MPDDPPGADLWDALLDGQSACPAIDRTGRDGLGRHLRDLYRPALADPMPERIVESVERLGATTPDPDAGT